MTLIVGIICKDAIVMAAESETTIGNAKRHGTRKITLVPFDGGAAIVGEAGVATLSGAVVDGFSTLAVKTKPVDEFTIAKLLEQSFRDVASRMGIAIGTESQSFFNTIDNYFELTVAYYFDSKPYLFKQNPAHVVIAKAYRSGFSVSGIGSDLAQYLLKDLAVGELDSRSATISAAHVVREVKTSVSGCGGNTEIALMSAGAAPEKLTPKVIQEMDSALETISKAELKQRMELFSKMLKAEHMQYESTHPEGCVVA